MKHKIKVVVFCGVITLFLMIVTLLYADKSGYADQRFIDQANQFDEEEGVRTGYLRYRPLNTEDSRQRTGLITPEYRGIEVVTESNDIKNNKSSSKPRFSFSEMAKTIRKNKKGSSHYSFKNMANRIKKESVPTFNFKLKE